MKKLLICIPDEMVEWVREIAKKRECAMSEVFRRGIESLKLTWTKKNEKKFVKKLRGNCEDY